MSPAAMPFAPVVVATPGLAALRCPTCNFLGMPPLFACPSCGSDKLSEEVLSGKGMVYTFTVVQMGFGHLASRAPYVLAVVELPEGPKLTTIIEGAPTDPAALRVGMPVAFSRMEEGTGPIFRLA